MLSSLAALSSLLLFFSLLPSPISGAADEGLLPPAANNKAKNPLQLRPLDHGEKEEGKEEKGNGIRLLNGRGTAKGDAPHLENPQRRRHSDGEAAGKKGTDLQLPRIDFHRDGHSSRSFDEDTAPPELATPELSASAEDGKTEISEDFLRRLSAQQVASQRAKLHRGGNLLRGPVNFEEALRVTVPYEEERK